MLVYFTDILDYVNKVDNNIQGRDRNILTSTDKLDEL